MDSLREIFSGEAMELSVCAVLGTGAGLRAEYGLADGVNGTAPTLTGARTIGDCIGCAKNGFVELFCTDLATLTAD